MMLSLCRLCTLVLALSLQAMVSCITISLPDTDAFCDDTSCPIMCVSSTCPAGGSGYVHVIEPIAASTSCQEVIVQSPGYPNGYPSGDCEWRFDTNAETRSSLIVTILDFDGEPTDTILEIVAIRSNSDLHTLFSGASGEELEACDCAERGPPYFYDRPGSKGLIVRFTPGVLSFKRGFRVRINFSEWGYGKEIICECSNDMFGVNEIDEINYQA